MVIIVIITMLLEFDTLQTHIYVTVFSISTNSISESLSRYLLILWDRTNVNFLTLLTIIVQRLTPSIPSLL